MIRFIFQRNTKLTCGAETVSHFTIDVDVPEIEEVLKHGGFGEDIYDYSKLIGVTLVEVKE